MTAETTQSADIAVIIVNYNTAVLTLQAVESVLTRTHGGRHVTIHLVDNASPEGDAQILAGQIAARGWQERVTLYPEKKNHGFGRGNNLVLRRLQAALRPPQAVFFLNPDARLDNEAIAILAQFLEDHPDAAMAGARIAKPGDEVVTAAFRFPNLINTFSRAVSFGPVSGRLAHWDVPLPPDIPTRQVDWVAGAAVLARFDCLNRAGFFDPAYFLYFEEVDLMRRIARQGGQIWHVTDAHVIHAEGAATGVASGQQLRKRRPAYWYYSWYYYQRKNHGWANTVLLAIVWNLGAVINTLICGLRGQPPAAPLHFHRDFWAMVGRLLLGLKAQPYD